jgi:putative membrane protein
MSDESSAPRPSGRARWRTSPPAWSVEGNEPDYRFTLANERTFLAWVRTALALIAGSVALVQLVPSFTVPGARRVLGVGVALAAAALAVVAYRRWVGNETAMRHAGPLPYSRMPAIVAILLAAAAVGVAVLAALK